MKAYEVTKALMEGKKVRDVDWRKDHYIYLKNSSTVIDDKGNESVALLSLFDREWEIYDDRKELPERLQWLKDACDFFENDCDGFECNKCPLNNISYLEEKKLCDIIYKCINTLNKKYKLD